MMDVLFRIQMCQREHLVCILISNKPYNNTEKDSD